MSTPDPRDGPRPPRGERTRAAILSAAWDLVAEHGYPAATVEAIAARARVGKPTIYRRWPNRARVVMEAFLSQAATMVPFPDTGSAMDDCRLRLSHVAQALTTDPGMTALAGVIGEAQQDPALATAIRDLFIAPLRVSARQMLSRGIARGELRADLDLEVGLDALFGPIYYRLLVSRAPLDERFTETLVEHVFAGIATGGGT